MNFFDQYKHPEWQKKRLEALEYAGFTCERCCDSETQLHVHHKRYMKGRKVWEYDVSELAVLCGSCHTEVHAEKEVLQALISAIPVEAIPEITALVAHYCASASGHCSGVDFSEHIKSTLENPFPSAVGKAAAILGNRCAIYSIIDLAEMLSAGAEGSTVSIRIKTDSGLLNGLEY